MTIRIKIKASVCAAGMMAAGLMATGVRAQDMPPLASAVSKGDLAAVTALLQQGANPDTLWQGHTVLTWASQDGKLAIVKALVAHHATVDPKVSDGNTPLRAAVDNRRLDVAAFLIDQGAKVNVQGRDGWTPLDDAESGRETKLVALLRQHGGANGLSPLLAAANRGDGAAVRTLLASGADPNVRDAGRMTAACVAAASGSLAALKALVEQHADVDAASGEGLTPLMLASAGGFKDVAAYLIAHGADLNVRNAAGLRALDMAVRYKQSAVAALLRASGAKDASETTDADCTEFRHYADMGATAGYASLITGPGDEFQRQLDLRPTDASLGGSGCEASDDGRWLACTFDKDNSNYGGKKDYDGYVAFAKACSGDSRIETQGLHTDLWYDRVADRTLLILIYATDDSMTVKFGADQPL